MLYFCELFSCLLCGWDSCKVSSITELANTSEAPELVNLISLPSWLPFILGLIGFLVHKRKNSSLKFPQFLCAWIVIQYSLGFWCRLFFSVRTFCPDKYFHWRYKNSSRYHIFLLLYSIWPLHLVMRREKQIIGGESLIVFGNFVSVGN